MSSPCPSMDRKSKVMPRGCGLLFSSQEPLLCRTLLYCVWGHESYLLLLCSPSHVSTHAHSEAHSPTPLASNYTNASCAPCHILPHTHTFACRHTHDIIYQPTNPHRYTYMHTQAHCHLYACVYAHGNTNTNQCILTHSRQLECVHQPGGRGSLKEGS